MILQSNWPKLLLPGLKARFDLQMKEHPDLVGELFNVETSKMATETTQGLGELGMPEEWTGSTHYETFKPGYNPTYTHKKYSLGIEIQKELLMFDQYGEIRKRVDRLGRSARYHRQYKGAELFNHGWDADNYAGIDGCPLISASHPTSPTDATTWSNSGTYELNADNVEACRNLMVAWKDDKGKLLVVEPDTLLVPPGQREAALVIAGTDGKPDVADHNINIWHGKLRVIEWKFLTTAYGLPDANCWFLLDSERAKEYLRWFDVRKHDFDDNVEWDSEVARYRVIEMFSRGYDHPSFIFGNNPA
jgi:phage major head subunit gpT-like protein